MRLYSLSKQLIRLLAAARFLGGQTSVYPGTRRGGVDERGLGRVLSNVKRFASCSPPDLKKGKSRLRAV